MSAVSKEWSYVTGAILLAIINIGYLAYTGHAWGITTAMTDAGLQIVSFFGAEVDKWQYFRDYTAGRLETDPFWETGWIIFGMPVGAMIAAAGACELRFKKIRSRKQVLWAVFGGILMGFGSRLAFGCNIGTLLNGIASQSLHGWIFLVGMICGTLLAIPIFKRYML